MKTVQKINNDVINYDAKALELIKNLHAKNATNEEFELLLYMSKKYNLDILARQIWCVKFGNAPAQIYAGRDGFLSIAHRSGKFDGMKSGTKGSIKNKDLIGYCEVFRNDMKNSFYIEVHFNEYTTNKNLWRDKPCTMIQKVAESQCLRRAFDISGLYSPEEMSMYEEEMKAKEKPKRKPKKPEIKMIEQFQKSDIWNRAKANNMNLQDLQEFSYNFTKKNDLSQLTFEEAEIIYKNLSEQSEMVQEVIFIEKEEDFNGTPLKY